MDYPRHGYMLYGTIIIKTCVYTIYTCRVKNNISVKFGVKYRIRSGNSIKSDLAGVSLIIDQNTSRSKLTMNRWELTCFLYLI